jgi:hypothetical protein
MFQHDHSGLNARIQVINVDVLANLLSGHRARGVARAAEPASDVTTYGDPHLTPLIFKSLQMGIPFTPVGLGIT